QPSPPRVPYTPLFRSQGSPRAARPGPPAGRPSANGAEGPAGPQCDMPCSSGRLPLERTGDHRSLPIAGDGPDTPGVVFARLDLRSEEHTSELQSPDHL